MGRNKSLSVAERSALADEEAAKQENHENGFENIDANGETAKQDIASSEAKAARQRRKIPTPTELMQAAKLMTFEDRAATILGLKNDLRADVQDEAARQEDILKEQQERLDRINALKNGE